jgi:hypothetical protein
MCDENVEWIEAGDPKAIPFAGRGRSKSSFAEMFRIFGETTDVLKLGPPQYVAGGDRVVTLGSWDIRAKATGKTASSDWAVDFTVRNSNVTRCQVYFDTGAVQAAFAATSKASA